MLYEVITYSGVQGEEIVVVENTPQVHNVIVCTLCSCYPWPVLGLPPTWYKTAAYRSRVVVVITSYSIHYTKLYDPCLNVKYYYYPNICRYN